MAGLMFAFLLLFLSLFFFKNGDDYRMCFDAQPNHMYFPTNLSKVLSEKKKRVNTLGPVAILISY